MTKKILLVSIVLISLMFITSQIAFASEPPPCNNGYTILGPPVVGTWVLDYISGSGPYTLNATFKGCCANCFGDCKASCNIRIEFPLYDMVYLPEQIPITFLENLNVAGWGPKNCNPIVGGLELKDLIIKTILKFDNQTDIDHDGKKELVADVVMFYWTCNP